MAASHKPLFAAVIALALCLGLVTQARAIEVFSANLTGSQEVPPRATTGFGFGTASLDGNFLSFTLSFGGLVSPTADAHIHCCTAVGANAGVAVGFTEASGSFPLGVLAGTFSDTFDLTDINIYRPAFLAAHGGTAESAAADLIAGLRTARTYLNIHTDRFPGGEIRGQLVPEPATLVLLGLALGILGLARRRKKPD